MVHGARERAQRLDDLVAWHISWTVAPHVKTPPSIEKILGRASLDAQARARAWKQERDQTKEET